MAYKKYKGTSKDKSTAQDKATKLIEKTNEKIKTFKHNPENVIEYLNFISQFNQYSARNNMLIQNQREGAVAVATFPKFKELGYAVNRGEKSMQILRPNIYEYFKKPDTEKIESVSKANANEKKLIADKKIPVFTKRTFSQMNVFDVTQTNMPKEDYPKIYPNAHVDFMFNGNDIENFNAALQGYCNNDMKIPVTIEHYDDLAKGKYYPLENRISLNDKNTSTENAHTLIHELAHSKMHNWKDIDSKDNALSSTNVKEYQAEMTTYVVAKHFGLDTEEHSITYISSWTDNLNQIEDENLFDIYSEVSNTSKEMVTEISKTIEELGLENGTSEMSDQTNLYPEETDEVTYCNLTGKPIGQKEPVHYCEGDLTYYKEEEIRKVLSERELEQLYELDLIYYTDNYYDNEEVLVPTIPENIPPRETHEELRNGINKIFLQEYTTNRIGLSTSGNLKEPLIEIAEPTNSFKKGECFSSSELKERVKTDIEKEPELANSPLAFIVKTNNIKQSEGKDVITNTTYKDSINVLEKEEINLKTKNNATDLKADIGNER
ncbi:ArdC-like ssDNA-binding domain-containing protein [Alkalibacterium sp. 20]|uniref:ArdC-like ssDNA-binding domain-containing protein n=1 Tax=Alkalibacterium sp. 20 TaxID=1798803 RepID=UPI00090016FD|nr:ArdC family protein [Alkalibacterium sp. 20]OJF96173.1 hypothetical protein AX762_05420 [Alkalibacterium sp. 20]